MNKIGELAGEALRAGKRRLEAAAQAAMVVHTTGYSGDGGVDAKNQEIARKLAERGGVSALRIDQVLKRNEDEHGE